MVEDSTRVHARTGRARLTRLRVAGAGATLVLAAACGVGGEGNGAQDVPTPLLSQEAGSGGDSSQVGSSDLVLIRVGGVEIHVEIADDAEERERGLMHRESVPEDQGMLFVYASATTRSFWMRNTLIPLDIAFIDPDGLIVDIQHMERTQTEELTTSRYPAMYALEMNLGWFEANGVEVGDRLEF